jgi:hypothetical protein
MHIDDKPVGFGYSAPINNQGVGGIYFRIDPITNQTIGSIAAVREDIAVATLNTSSIPCLFARPLLLVGTILQQNIFGGTTLMAVFFQKRRRTVPLVRVM